MAELINRPAYLNQLIQNKDVDLVKIVTGIRRCGKSALLDLFHQYLVESGITESNIIHMNLESLRYRSITDYLTFYDYVSERIAKEGKTYLIFDEPQAVEHWEKAIESFRLDFDVDIYITGSNAYMLSSEFKDKHAEIAWNEIVKMRHVLVHGYYHISIPMLWSIVQEDLPELSNRILPILEASDDL